MEIDWSVGQIVAKLKELDLDEKTLIVYTSDNGPWLQYGIDGGSAGPLRDGKGTLYEGGVRVPCVMRWPGHIPAGRRTSEIAANMDLLPTFAALAGAELPRGRVLDGRDLWPILSGAPGARSPHQTFFYFGGGQVARRPNLRAVRDERWKLLVRLDDDGQLQAAELFDLAWDISERENRLADHPQIAERLVSLAQQFYNQLSQNVRPLGRVD